MSMRPFPHTDYSQMTEGVGRLNVRRDIEAARQGSNKVWASATNPFKIWSGDWVVCFEADAHTRQSRRQIAFLYTHAALCTTAP